MTEITIREAWHIVKRKVHWILLAAIVATVATWLYYAVQPNVYTSEAQLYVLMGYVDSTGTLRYDVSTSSSFAGDFKELIKTPQVLEESAKALGVEKLPEDADISVEAVSGTRIIKILTTYTDPEACVRITNTVAKVFSSYVGELTKSNSISIASEAVLPDEPSGPRRMLMTLVAFLVVTVLGVLLALAVSILDTKVRSDQVITEKLGLSMLAQVQDYKKMIDRFARQPRDSAVPLYECLDGGVREQIRLLSLNMRFAAMDQPLKSVMMVSTTPEEGKSSLSTLLASQQGEEDKRVLLIDLDFRHPSLGKYVGRRGKFDLVNYFEGKCTLNQLVLKTPIRNVYLIDAHQHNVLVSRMVESAAFSEMLEQLYETFDLVILDVPPIGMFVEAALLGSKVSGVVLVVADGKVDIQDLTETANQLHKVNANILGCVLNLMDERTVRSKHSYYKNYDSYPERKTVN